jgi:antitoxin CptB
VKTRRLFYGGAGRASSGKDHQMAQIETDGARLKRMSMRSWRRGTKEMDLILGPYSDAHLEGMGSVQLDLYDALLEENDQDLYAMILGQQPSPPALAQLLQEIGDFARTRLAKG